MMAVTAFACCAVSIVIVAVAGRQPPRRIQTFTRSSDAERRFYQNTGRLRIAGISGLALAAMIAAACAVAAVH
jgi:hypothetical protein